jgi:hypothetical protein
MINTSQQFGSALASRHCPRSQTREPNNLLAVGLTLPLALGDDFTTASWSESSSLA